jgi:hypothetical protein
MNVMRTPNSAFAAIGAPHVALFVTNLSGLRRVWLDTGKVELVDSSPDAIAVDDTTRIGIENGQYVIARGADRIVVRGIEADRRKYRLVLAHDRHAFAIEQPRDEIAIVSLRDGTVHRISLGPRTEHWSPSLTWAKDDSALLVADGEDRYRLDLSTGAHTPIDKLEWKINEPPPATDCAARGLRLERRVTKQQQTIALVTLATSSNPEQLPAIQDRELVAATNYTGGSGRWDPQPGELEPVQFTPACEHFVFTLEDRIYVGSIATGRYAFLMRGTPIR